MSWKGAFTPKNIFVLKTSTPRCWCNRGARYLAHLTTSPGRSRITFFIHVPRPVIIGYPLSRLARLPEKLQFSFVWLSFVFYHPISFFAHPAIFVDAEKGSSPKEMMDEIDRLKTFEPPEKSDENKVNVKLFLEEDIRFLELDPDVSYEELIIAVGKVFIESYVIKFEVGCARVTVAALTSHASRDASHALRNTRGCYVITQRSSFLVPCSPFSFPFNFQNSFPAGERWQPTLAF